MPGGRISQITAVTGGQRGARGRTWIHIFYDADFWTVPGGDFDAAASASRSVKAPGIYIWGITDRMVGGVL